MKKIFTLSVCLLATGVINAQTYHPLATSAFSQNWTNIGLITANDIWTGVPSIQGFLGDDASGTVTAVDPQTLLSATYSTTLDVVANRTTPNTETGGGVYEFEITNPVVSLQGSGTADAPNLVIYLNTTGRSNIMFSFLARDIDGAADDATQQIAVQYRIGTTGDFINIPAGYIADASTGPSLATLATPVSFVLPSAVDNQAQVQIRIITSNAASNDEHVGIDDITVSQGSALPLKLTSFNANYNGRSSQLTWTTNSEVGVKGFSVEKSLTSAQFSEIGFVAAKNNNLQNSYSLDDLNVKSGANYYRLKMIDKDGSVSYSSVVLINNSRTIKAQLFPNPTRGNLNVSHPRAVSGARISILSAEGRQVKSYSVESGALQTNLILSDLTNGNYMLIFDNDGVKSTTKFVKN